jgi:hypothetical protein
MTALERKLDRPLLAVQRSPRTSASLERDRQQRVELGPSTIRPDAAGTGRSAPASKAAAHRLRSAKPVTKPIFIKHIFAGREIFFGPMLFERNELTGFNPQLKIDIRC